MTRRLRGLWPARTASAWLWTLLLVSLLGPAGAKAWEPVAPGNPVWRGGSVSWILNQSGSVDLGSIETSERIARQAMDDWTLVSCTSLESSYGGRTSTRPESGDSVFVVGWLESGWPHSSDAIGVTPIASFDGRIYEADIQLNGVDYTWIEGSGRGTRVNTYSIILHEGGHFYGLGHSSSRDATMFAAYGGGILSLTSDDQAGICALYPGSGSDCRSTGCPSGQVCTDGVCVRETSGTGEPCAPCNDDDDCSNGYCLPYPSGAACGVDCRSQSECPADYVCADVGLSGGLGQCVRVVGETPTCADVEPGGCDTDFDCEASERCNTGTRACEARPVAGGALGDGCELSSDCTSGICIGGICSQTCNWLQPASCPGGFHCSGAALGSCSGGGAGVCVAGGAGAGAIGSACGSDTDCASIYCANGRCAQPCQPGALSTCASDQACRPGAASGCGACEPQASMGEGCAMNQDCVSDVCLATGPGRGFCSEGCASDADCGDGYDCTDVGGTSYCIPVEGGQGGQCDGNEDCLSGLCASPGPAGYCTRLCDAAACPVGYECVLAGDGVTRACARAGASGCGCTVPGRGSSGGRRGAIPVAMLLSALVAIATSRSRCHKLGARGRS